MTRTAAEAIMREVETEALAQSVRADDRPECADMYREFAEPLLGLWVAILRVCDAAEMRRTMPFGLAVHRIEQLRDPERSRP